MKDTTVIDTIAEFVGYVGATFISAVLIMWGWNTVAPHLNAPQFGYWEVYAMRMGLKSFIKLFKKN
jgi:hypothetical protein